MLFIKTVILAFVFYNTVKNTSSASLGRKKNVSTFGKVLVEGDIVLNNRLKSQMGRKTENTARELITTSQLRWPSSRNRIQIPYVTDGLGSATTTLLNEAIKTFKRLTCIEFTTRDDEPDYISFMNGRGCYSSVGRQGGKQELSLGTGCNSLGTVLHEMMHALGFFHEQSRPDRDKYVRIIHRNIQKGKESQFKSYQSGFMDTAGEPYDLHSLMHYKNNEFSKNGLNTIQSKSDPSVALGNNFLSKVDVLQVNKLLECPTRYWEVTEYSVTVYTSNFWFAGTDSNVFLELKSSNGDSTGEFQLQGQFEAGNSDITADIIATCLLTVNKVTIRHDNTGYLAGWHLHKINVMDKKDGKSYIFPCNCWLAGNDNTKFLVAA